MSMLHSSHKIQRPFVAVQSAAEEYFWGQIRQQSFVGNANLGTDL